MSCVYLEHSACGKFSFLLCAFIFAILAHYLTSLRDVSCSGVNSSSSIQINVNAFIFTSQEYGLIFFSSCVAPAPLIITSIIQDRRVGRFSLFIVFCCHTACKCSLSFIHSFKNLLLAFFFCLFSFCINSLFKLHVFWTFCI